MFETAAERVKVCALFPTQKEWPLVKGQFAPTGSQPKVGSAGPVVLLKFPRYTAVY